MNGDGLLTVLARGGRCWRARGAAGGLWHLDDHDGKAMRPVPPQVVVKMLLAGYITTAGQGPQGPGRDYLHVTDAGLVYLGEAPSATQVGAAPAGDCNGNAAISGAPVGQPVPAPQDCDKCEYQSLEWAEDHGPEPEQHTPGCKLYQYPF